MRKLVLFAAALVVVACSPAPTSAPSASPVAGLDLSPRVADRPTGGEQALLDQVPAVATTTTLMDLAVHARPGGPDQALFGEPFPISIQRRLVILGDAVAAGGTAWLRVYVLPNEVGVGWNDFFTWIPTTIDGRPTVEAARMPECPPTRDNLSTLAALDPFSRARCMGTTAFTVDGTVGRVSPAPYAVTPAWFESRGSDSPAFSLVPSTAGRVVFRVPPGVAVPPLGITVRATAHVADRAAADCRRTDPGDLDLPVETGPDSQLWCAVQIVVEQWVPVLGLEGRPFDAKAPQVRHTEASSVCAGVGSGPLTFRINPDRLDPVWLEAEGGLGPIRAWFTPGFEFTFDPEPGVVDAEGQVVARDGSVVNPDGRLAGHLLCMTGQGLFVE